MLASMSNAAELSVEMLLNLNVRLLLCVWELLNVWVLDTVCCRLKASEFELCGLIERENHSRPYDAITGSGHM